MSGTTVVTTGEPETVVAPIDTTAAETAHAEARVEVAEIEANRDVAIAETNAEVQEAAIEAAVEVAKENATKEEVEECQRNLQAIQSQVVSLETAVQSIQTTLTERLPPPNQPQTDNPESVEEGRPAPEPEAPKRKHRVV